MTSLDLVTVGRVSVDLYGQQLGAGWAEVTSFAKAVGGTATNVAVAAARLGRRSAVVTRIGGDPLGQYVRQTLDAYGVDTRFVGVEPELPTPLALAVTEVPDAPSLLFYRQPAAPDLQLRAEHLPPDVVTDVPVLWLTGTGFSAEPSRSAHRHWLTLRERRRHTVLDLDYRPGFWEHKGAAREALQPALARVTVAVGNRTECGIATGTEDPDAAADRLLGEGVELAVVKLGADGVLVASASERTTVPPIAVEVVCGLGAGDAFGGALVHGLLAGWPAADVVAYANAAGALVASRLLCSEAMPTAEEIDTLLQMKESP